MLIFGGISSIGILGVAILLVTLSLSTVNIITIFEALMEISGFKLYQSIGNYPYIETTVVISQTLLKELKVVEVKL